MAMMNLLLLPGDGIGPEVMAEVKTLIAWMNDHGMGTFETEEGLCGGCAYDAHGVAVTDETVAKAEGRGCGAVRLGRRAEVGQGALRASPGGRPAATAQGPEALCQPASRRDLSGAGGCLLAQARTGRGPRHHDPARAHRRRLFRRAEDHHRSRQRPEARGRHAGLRHLRDRAHLAGRLRARAQAAQQGDLDGEAQRHEDRRAVERGRNARCTRAISRTWSWSICWPMPAGCSSCAIPSSST